jgi:hypothetical protein
MACQNGDVEAVRALVELGAAVNHAAVGCVDVTFGARSHVNLKSTFVCLFVCLFTRGLNLNLKGVYVECVGVREDEEGCPCACMSSLCVWLTCVIVWQLYVVALAQTIV